MKSGRRSLVAVLCVCAALAGSLAFAPQEARAVSTDYLVRQVQSLRSALSRVISTNRAQATSISNLHTRVDAAETTGIAQGARLDGLEASHAALAQQVASLGQPEPDADFWPDIGISVNPSFRAVWDIDNAEQVCAVFMNTEITDVATGAKITPGPTPDFVRVTVGSDVIAAQGGIIDLPYTPDSLPSGTPLTIEWWMECYGERVHGSATITEWAWTP